MVTFSARTISDIICKYSENEMRKKKNKRWLTYTLGSRFVVLRKQKINKKFKGKQKYREIP